MSDEPEDPSETFRVPLVLSGLNDVPIMFVNWMSVNHQGSEFVLTFGQYSQPIFAGGPPTVDQLKRSGPVPIKVVARLGVPAARMMDMVRALSENLSKYEQQKGLNE